MVEPDAHPPEELLFRWRGGHEVLNFTATVGERWRHGIERLREPDDLSRWLVDAGLAPAPVSVTRRDLNEARELREAMYRVATGVRTAGRSTPTTSRRSTGGQVARLADPGSSRRRRGSARFCGPPPPATT